MEFTAMDARAYRSLNADQYQERRSLVLSLAEELPEDATEEQIRSIDEEMGYIKAEDERRDAMTQLRNHKAAEVIGGAGNVVSSVDKATADSGGPEARAASVGEHFAEYVRKHGHEKSFHLVAPAYKRDAATPSTMKSPTAAATVGSVTTYDKNVVEGAREPMGVLNLLSRETIEGNTLVFFREGALVGAPATTAEGAAKSQVSFAEPTPVTVTLEKIAAWVKESDEYIDDYNYLASAINGRLLYELDYVRQGKVITDLLATSGIQTIGATTPIARNAMTVADEIANAISDVMTQSGRAANGIIMTPEIWKILRVGKYTGSGEYVGGGYFAALQGENIWNLPIVLSSQLTANHVVVGAFDSCASIVTKADGVTVESTNTDQDDFIKNLMTVRAEVREKLAVRRPAGFVDIKVAAAS